MVPKIEDGNNFGVSIQVCICLCGRGQDKATSQRPRLSWVQLRREQILPSPPPPTDRRTCFLRCPSASLMLGPTLSSSPGTMRGGGPILWQWLPCLLVACGLFCLFCLGNYNYICQLVVLVRHLLDSLSVGTTALEESWSQRLPSIQPWCVSPSFTLHISSTVNLLL